MSSWFAFLLQQQQVVQFDDDVGEVGELHKVRGDDVDSTLPWSLSLNPGHDGWQVSMTTEGLHQKVHSFYFVPKKFFLYLYFIPAYLVTF